MIFSGYLNNKQLLQKANEENDRLKKQICNYEKELDEYKTENRELKRIRIEAEHRATTYARAIKQIEDEMQNQQFNSVENLTNKIKSILETISTRI